MFTHKNTVKMYHTDTAGVIFFGSLYMLAQDAIEAFFKESIKMPFSEVFEKKEFYMPVVHSEANYKRPMMIGTELTMELHVKSVGKTSISFHIDFYNDDREFMADVLTIHVFVSTRDLKKRPLPERIRQAFTKEMEGTS